MVSSVSSTAGLWSVVVVADVLVLQRDGTRKSTLLCAQVTMTGADGSYVALALPAPVACPGTRGASTLAYDEVADPGGPIGQSVTGFLSAYLAGQGQFDRFVSPGARTPLGWLAGFGAHLLAPRAGMLGRRPCRPARPQQSRGWLYVHLDVAEQPVAPVSSLQQVLAQARER